MVALAPHESTQVFEAVGLLVWKPGNRFTGNVGYHIPHGRGFAAAMVDRYSFNPTFVPGTGPGSNN